MHGHAPNVCVNGVCGLINPEPKLSILDCVTGMVLLAQKWKNVQKYQWKLLLVASSTLRPNQKVGGGSTQEEEKGELL